MRIGVIGLGKRFFNVYAEILEKLNCDLVVWNRTIEKSESYVADKKHKIVKDLSDLANESLDICLCFLPSNVSYDVLSPLISKNIKFPILIETPVTDIRWQKIKNIGVLEQWTYLPVEQFKQLIYKEAVIEKPYLVFNDGRSYDYHAIAQLRNYVDLSNPLVFKGSMQNEHNGGFIDKNGNLNETSNLWTHGQVELSNGTILMHSFSYNCKMTNLIPIQLIRSYSSNGSIISGRIDEMDNDYEMFQIRYIDNKKNVIVEKVIRSGEKTTMSLSLKIKNISWNNKFGNLKFNDQQTAISYMLTAAKEGILYKPIESIKDTTTIEALKKSAMTGNTLSVRW